MSTIIQETVLDLLPANRRRSMGGWISFNAPCCHHRGHRTDSRGRGGMITDGDGSVSYHCFNCNFKVSYRPGWYLGYKFRKLLEWLGADQNTIHRLVIEAISFRNEHGQGNFLLEKIDIQFKPRSLPNDVVPVQQDLTALNYCLSRKINLTKYPLLVSQRPEHNLNRRIIIPFTWQHQLIGYTARSWDSAVNPKYHSQYDSNYVFNIDQQHRDSQFVIVCEGPFDAMSVDGVAILGNECNETQADIIDNLGREVIVVPDRDRAGSKLITNAIDYGWSVSFPVWLETSKDINEATVHHGPLFVLKTILDARETSKLKIELMRKRLYT